MIKKATLLKENTKLKRKIFIWENINISVNSSVSEKEIAAKEFIEKHPGLVQLRLLKKNNGLMIIENHCHNFLFIK